MSFPLLVVAVKKGLHRGFAKAPAALVGPLRGPEAVKPFVAMPGQPIDPPAGVWSPLEIGNYIGSAAGELYILF